MRSGRFKRSLPWLALAMALALPARAEDLLQVYAQARAADPLLASAHLQRQLQQEAGVQARAALLPQWSLEASESRRDGERSRSASSHVSQALIDLASLRQWQAAETLGDAQSARVRAAEQALCARVATAYFGVLSAEAALSTAEANEQAFAQQVAQAQSRFAAGLSAQVDVDQARAYRELARGATLQAREALADARQALAELTGQLPARLQPLQPKLPVQAPQPHDAQAWVDQALARNPILQAYALQLRAGEQKIAAAQSAHLPTLALGLDSQRQTGAGVPQADAGRTLNTLALRLTIPLFAGGATESQKRQAVLQRDLLREEQEQARRTLLRETQAQYQAVLGSIAQIDSAEAAVQAASQMLEATRAGQNLGTRSMTDLLLAIQTLANAQNALAQARHRHVLATLLLQQAAGGLGEEALALVNQLLVKES